MLVRRNHKAKRTMTMTAPTKNHIGTTPSPEVRHGTPVAPVLGTRMDARFRGGAKSVPPRSLIADPRADSMSGRFGVAQGATSFTASAEDD
jgi:hypothetical protein